ncbi:MAG: hypothetical protein JO232_23890, partial [Verrucomicrobia bacterium]|nr:hypothetical protein [Verrucomicrobiota bacterium]
MKKYCPDFALAMSPDPQWVRPWSQRLAAAGHAVWFYLGKLLWHDPLGPLALAGAGFTWTWEKGIGVSEYRRVGVAAGTSQDKLLTRMRHGLARPLLRPARGTRWLDCADRSAAEFSGLANGGTEFLLRGEFHGTTSVLRSPFHW